MTVTLIARIADYERGMAQAAAVTKRLEDSLDDLRGNSADLSALGHEASAAGRDMTGLAAETAVAAHEVNDLGDEADKAGRDVLGLAARIEVAKAALHGLSLEFAGSGDDSLTPKIRQARRELAELQRVARTLTPPGGGEGLLSTLGDLGASLRGSMIPIAIGVGLAASPAIAAAVGAAVVGGIGIGGIIGGIALASRDPRVPAAFRPLGAQMMTGLTQDANVFVGPLLAVADDIGAGWEARIRPHIAAIFENLAPSLRGLGAGGVGFLDHLSAGLESVSRAAGPFLDQFAQDLPELGADIERFMNSVSDAGPEVTRFFHDMNSGLGTTIAGLGKFIQFGSELNDVLPVGGLVASLGRLSDATDTNVETNDAWIRSLFGVSGALINVRKLFDDSVTTSNVASTATLAVSAAMSTMNSALVKNATTAAMAGAANQELTASFQNAAGAAGGLKIAFDALNGTELTQRETTRQAEAAVDDLQAALKASSGSLNVHTAAGRAAAAAADQLARSAVNSAQAILDNGGSVERARAAYDHYIGVLRSTLSQAGLTKGQIDRLIASIAAMPTSKTVTISQHGAQAATGQVNSLVAAIGRVNSKTVTVTTNIRTVQTGPIASARAEGGPVEPGVPYRINERGFETVTFPAFGQVHPANLSPARTWNGGSGSSGGGGAPTTVVLDVRADSEEQAARIRKQVRILGGGNVQLAYGSASF